MFDLLKPEEDKEREDAGTPKRPWWRRKRWMAFIAFILLLVWLDGPGWRWIGHRAAAHFLPELSPEFELTGRLTGGEIGLSGVRIGEFGAVRIASLDDVEVRYRLSEIVKGRVGVVRLSGLHADIDLSKLTAKEEQEEEEKKHPATVLRSLRERLVPMEISLDGVSARIHRDGEALFEITKTSVIHVADESDFQLDLGDMSILGDRKVAAQSTALVWQEDELRLSGLDVLPALGIRYALVRHPGDEELAFGLALLVDGVRFNAESDLRTLSFSQEDRTLRIGEAAENIGFPIPANANLDSLELKARGLESGPAGLAAELKIALSQIDYDDWTAPNLNLSAQMEGNALDLLVKGRALDSPIEVDADVELDRTEGVLPTTARIRLSVPELGDVLALLRDRFTPSENPVDPPPSGLMSTVDLSFSEGVPESAEADLVITARSDAPPINLKADWNETGEVGVRLTTPGLDLSGDYRIEAAAYEGVAEIADFDPAGLAPWLDPFSIGMPTGLTTSLAWKGSGDIGENVHRGDFELRQLEWQRDGDEQPVKAFATASYVWPERLELTPLNVQQGAQKIEGDVHLADRILELRKLSWTDGEDVLLNGIATVPVPADPTDLKALMRETRPVSVDIESTRISLGKLHPFLPENIRFRDDSATELDIKLSGSMSEPVLDAKVIAENLGITTQPDIPVIAVNLAATGRENTLKIEGDITSPEYPPMTLDVVTNWSPDQWAEDPEVIKRAKLDASAKISDFKLELLSKFVPDARKLAGNLNIDLEVGGTVGEPEPMGTVTLEGGVLEFDDAALPRLKDTTLKVTAVPEKVTIETLRASVSGGTLDIGGALDLVDGKPSEIDLRIDGKQLPARRDDAMIIRLNTGVRISGPWESATVSGRIGVVDSLFYKDIEILPIGVPFNQPSEPSLPAIDAPSAGEPTAAVPEPFRNWKLDMKLVTENAFLIRGNLATGQAFLKVDVGGTIATPRPSGEATMWKVEAKLPFSTLRIQKGTVKFRPNAPFDPILDIRGESTIRPYEVRVYIYGPVSDPKILPTSNPPLPETEIMTLVATGTTTSGFEDPDVATARAAQLLVEEIRNGRVKYLSNLGPLLKVLEKVEFQIGERDPYTSTKYNSATVNLSDNWLVRAGISEEGNTRTTLVYLFRFR